LIGDLLRDIAKHSQVIAITHLPQIASQAQHLVMVEKKFIKDNQQERTISSAELLKLKSSKDIYDIMVPRH
jgi:DNA repair protein RecN (Recombination protein N)